MDADFQKRMDDHEARTAELAAEVHTVKMEQVEYVKLLKENTDTTVQMKATVDQMYEVFQSWQGAFKVLEWIGKVAKPVAAIVGMVAAALVAWKGAK